MKKLIVFLLLGSSVAYGQRGFTIDETVYGPGKYAAKTLPASKWIKNMDAISNLDSTYQNLVKREAKNNWQPVALASVTELQTALKKILPNEEIKLRNFPTNYNWIDSQNIQFVFEGKNTSYLVTYDSKQKEAKINTSLPKDRAGEEYSHSNKQTAYLVGNNIEIIKADGSKIKVTQDTVDGIVNGSSVVHRNEFGISKGMWWSPDDQKLLYYKKNETMVSKYPLAQWDTRVATIKDIRYPMAGMKSEEVTLNIYDTETGNYVQLQTGEPKEQYLTIVTWDPSGKYVYVGVLNRGQDHLKLNKYDSATGSLVQTLFEESSNTWVEPQVSLVFVPNNPDLFLYQTDKDGFNQLYLYNTQGKLIKKLGYNNAIVTDFKGFDEKGKKGYYIASINQGMERHLFEVELKSGKTVQLTKTNGIHNASVSSSGEYVLDQYSNLSTPNVVQINHRKTDKTANLVTAANPFTGKIDLPKIEFKSFTSADGKTPLNARITYPSNFDPNKKYPVMVYLYGGSHAQLVTDRWLGGVGYFDLYMAQNGYLVFTMDNRGSDARDRDFTRVTHRNLGEAEMADQLVGINYLKSQPYVDADKMGIFGWSFGGFMTSSLMTKHNDIFKAAVAGGPVMDWKYYEVMYGERYMDTPEENPEGYEKTSMLNKADRLNGHLLIIHGAQDPVVVQQHSMDFVQKCIEAGKQVDYFLYPTHEHNVMGKDRIHMYDKIAKYFDLYLK